MHTCIFLMWHTALGVTLEKPEKQISKNPDGPNLRMYTKKRKKKKEMTVFCNPVLSVSYKRTNNEDETDSTYNHYFLQSLDFKSRFCTLLWPLPEKLWISELLPSGILMSDMGFRVQIYNFFFFHWSFLSFLGGDNPTCVSITSDPSRLSLTDGQLLIATNPLLGKNIIQCLWASMHPRLSLFLSFFLRPLLSQI